MDTTIQNVKCSFQLRFLYCGNTHNVDDKVSEITINTQVSQVLT